MHCGVVSFPVCCVAASSIKENEDQTIGSSLPVRLECKLSSPDDIRPLQHAYVGKTLFPVKLRLCKALIALMPSICSIQEAVCVSFKACGVCITWPVHECCSRFRLW
ncbi:hypothetical protein Droror1_Dr00019093 [Drosera rotundifolia]